MLREVLHEPPGRRTVFETGRDTFDEIEPVCHTRDPTGRVRPSGRRPEIRATGRQPHWQAGSMDTTSTTDPGEWVTLFTVENLSGLPRPGFALAV
ncbi:hypothetical protein GCM10009663_24440 [Kitasatospora arboriphila]|uniref:Uncharacterized protein n=1 Tax=Kitasatospora arboriphila TaxID=258052 RepID=A0ABP4E296_9ACTN